MGEHPKTHSWGGGRRNWEKLGGTGRTLVPVSCWGPHLPHHGVQLAQGTSARQHQQLELPKGAEEEAVQSKLINQGQGIFWVGGNPQGSNATAGPESRIPPGAFARNSPEAGTAGRTKDPARKCVTGSSISQGNRSKSCNCISWTCFHGKVDPSRGTQPWNKRLWRAVKHREHRGCTRNGSCTFN